MALPSVAIPGLPRKVGNANIQPRSKDRGFLRRYECRGRVSRPGTSCDHIKTAGGADLYCRGHDASKATIVSAMGGQKIIEKTFNLGIDKYSNRYYNVITTVLV